jgi:dCMP deaminase
MDGLMVYTGSGGTYDPKNKSQQGTYKTHWDKRFFDLCDLVASWSEDTSRKIGCVIVGSDNEVRSIGFNGLPRKVLSYPSRLSRDNGEKYLWTVHAEENAFLNAARIGVSIKGCRLYSNLFPCSNCMRGVIQSGVSEVISYKFDENDPTFAKSFEVSLQMAKEAGIRIDLFEREVK